MKRVYYDADADVLYLGAVPGVEEEFVEIGPDIHAELDMHGKVIGIEVLRASRTLRPVRRAFSGRISRGLMAPVPRMHVAA
jgi:uncharacterized protein YuzE